ncbi:MAG: Maf family protein [Chthoniobacterales bacterium]|nr:Maf family protein [Chthoniobacterales bacterium]
MEGSELILASASPRRQEILRLAGIKFRIEEAKIEEIVEGKPKDVCLRNAVSKAFFVFRRFPKNVVLAADTIVVLEGKILGKPSNYKEAEEMLASLNGKIHEVYTGVCIKSEEKLLAFFEVSRVKIRQLRNEDIRRYYGRIFPLDKAGAYSAQEDFGEIIEVIEGSKTNVIGLPLKQSLKLLERFRIFPRKKDYLSKK